MSRIAWAGMFLVLLTGPLATASAAKGGKPASADGKIRLPVTRDTWVSNVGSEGDSGLGGAPKLKLKSIQEMSLIDIDPGPLRGWVIEKATLHLQNAGGPPLLRVTVSSLGAEWFEGTAASYAPQNGSSTFRHRRHPNTDWTIPGSDLCSVVLGAGGTLWRMADATPPDAQGWQTVPVDPQVLATRVAGLGYGFLVFDDTGSEWTRQGDKFNLKLFPNRFVYSRDAGAAHAPHVTVQLGAEDRDPPKAPRELRSWKGDLPTGEAWVSWVTPADRGPAGTLGFRVRRNGKEVPRYLIPLAGRPGERVRMHLRDLDLEGGSEIPLEVEAVDAAGNIGPAATHTVTVSGRMARPLPASSLKPFAGEAMLPRLGDAEVAILDELDKVHPVTGVLIPEQPAGYRAANHLWSAKAGQVRLQAARNELVGFQVLLQGTVTDVQPALTFSGDAGRKIQVSFGRYRHVPSGKGPLPDPIVPLRGGLSIPDDQEKISAQKSASLHCEIHVPHDLEPGRHAGKLVLKAGDKAVTLDVDLQVWNFTLPAYLSFLPEMNAYGLPGNERAYFRLAHRHRTVLNVVPYSHSGSVHEGLAPPLDAGRLSWSAWDRRFGPLFDGSAFADLPRRGVPLECFYLPMFENWPTPMEGNYNGNYWADRAFPPEYRRRMVDVSRQMAEHFQAKGWNDTLFHFFFNGKNSFKAAGWSRGTCPWLLDEPASFQDFWALRYFGSAFHEGVNQAPRGPRMVFRCDISRPQWQRNSLDGLLDYNVVGGAMRPYHRLVFDRKQANGELTIEYGGTNAIEESNLQPLGWCLDAWSLGTDGVLPWQTLGTSDSWRKADSLALLYPPRGGQGEPGPSIRLKAYLRGQQDVEYLTLLAQLQDEPRWAMGQKVRQALRLAGQRKGSGFVGGEDAGLIDFSQLRPQDAWALRVRVGQALSEAAPRPRRRLVDLRTPPRDPAHLAPGYVSTPSGAPDRHDP